jgi:hypothetical protein
MAKSVGGSDARAHNVGVQLPAGDSIALLSALDMDGSLVPYGPVLNNVDESR